MFILFSTTKDKTTQILFVYSYYIYVPYIWRYTEDSLIYLRYDFPNISADYA